MRVEITPERAGQRLDKVLVDAIEGVGRARAARWFGEGRVQVFDGERARRARKGELAVVGQSLRVHVAATEIEVRAAADEGAPLSVVLERPELLVVDKPAGQPCAPRDGRERGCVANALVARYPETAYVGYGPLEPGLCHRLDNDTSGLLLCARTTPAFEALTAALRAGEIDKRYLLLCEGAGLPDEGTIELPLASAGRRMRVSEAEGRPATTHYRVLRRAGGLTLVEAHAPVAQRHQLRAHFAALGHPLLGDERYGGQPSELGRHALHASHLRYAGNDSIAGFDVSSPFPEALAGLLP